MCVQNFYILNHYMFRLRCSHLQVLNSNLFNLYKNFYILNHYMFRLRCSHLQVLNSSLFNLNKNFYILNHYMFRLRCSHLQVLNNSKYKNCIHTFFARRRYNLICCHSYCNRMLEYNLCIISRKVKAKNEQVYFIQLTCLLKCEATQYRYCEIICIHSHNTLC
jgi:hypothetical protein